MQKFQQAHFEGFTYLSLLLLLTFQTALILTMIHHVLSPIDDSNNGYVLTQNSFTQLEQLKFYMKGYQFQAQLTEQQNIFNDINLNSQTQFVIWQNITFSQNQIIKGIQINFVNLKVVIFFNITLSLQTLDMIENNSQYSNSSLFYFENVEKVFIYDLTIEKNNFSNTDYSSILFIKSVKEVYIQYTHINNNQGNINIIKLDKISKIIFDNFYIQSNKCFDQNTQRKFIIFFCQGCLEVIISKTVFTQNELVQFIETVNQYELDQGVFTYSKDSIQLINMTVYQNNFNFQQIISITQSYVNLKNISFISNAGNVKISDARNMTIQESVFQNNQGLNGGAFSIFNLKENLIIKQTNITQNKAIGSGGGVYLENIQTKNIEISSDCQIQKNSALIGGGVRILNKSSKQIIPSQYPFNFVVEQNNAELYGDNTCTFLQNILIQNGYEENGQTQNNNFKNLTYYDIKYQIIDVYHQILGKSGYLGYAQVSDFKSGGNINLNIFFIDENQKKLKFSKDKLKQKDYPEDIIEEIESLSIVIQQGSGNENSVILTGETILNINLYNETCNCFQIKQLMISSTPSITKLLQIQFYTNKYSNQVSQTLVEFEFRKCLLGEVIQQASSNIQTCNFCSTGTYQLDDPNSIQNKNQDQLVCKKCPDSASNCIGNEIKLRNGYWRKDNNTDEILPCDSKINSCKSEDLESREQGCSKGFVGPLCEVCDLEGRVWDKQYISSFDGTQCTECSSKLLQYTYFIAQGVFLLVYQIQNSLKSFESIQYSQTCYYLRQIQILPVSRINMSSLTTSYLKIIVSYFQFSSFLTFKESFIPAELNIVPNLFGSSNKMITISMDCIIPIDWLKQFEKSFVLSLVNFFLPILYILFSIFIFQLFKDSLFPIKHQGKYVVYILLSVIYMFFLLDTVQFFTSMLTCRQIGSYSYNTIDLLNYCNEEKHTLFLKLFSISALTIWTIIPLILIFFLSKQKKSLDYCLKKFKYGYFYLELKNEFYYWEFLRILLKLLVVIVNTLLKQEYLMISRQIIIIMFAQYIKLTSSFKPFLSSELQQMEILSIQLIIAKILFQTCKELLGKGKLFFEIIVFLTDAAYISYFLLSISKYIINNSQSMLGKIIQITLKKFVLNKFIKVQQKQSKRILQPIQRWKKIKNNIQQIRQQNYNISSSIPNQVNQSQAHILTPRVNSQKNLLRRKTAHTQNFRSRQQSAYNKENSGQISQLII